MEFNNKPYCNCIARGVWKKHDGFSRDIASGLWVCGRCRKPTKMNYERSLHGEEQIECKNINDIYEYERTFDEKKAARLQIEDELEFDEDWIEDDEDF